MSFDVCDCFVGFTRPRVLVLLPTRNECLDLIQTIFKLAPKIQTDRVANKKKFFQEFYEDTYVPFSRKPGIYIFLLRNPFCRLDDFPCL